MKFKVKDYWGAIVLNFEDGTEGRAEGQMVKWSGVVGRLWSISDKSSHCGGHGMGSITSSQAVIATKDMKIVPVKLKWDSGYELEMINNTVEGE